MVTKPKDRRFTISIRMQMVLFATGTAFLLSIFFAHRAASITGTTVRRQLAREVAQNTSNFLATQNMPMSDQLMKNLAKMFDVDFVAVAQRSSGGGVVITGTSLPGDQIAAFRSIVERLSDVEMIDLGGNVYHSHFARIERNHELYPDRSMYTLYVLVPEGRFEIAAHSAADDVFQSAVVVVVIILLVSVLLGLAVSNPIHQLADEMDRMRTSSDSAVANRFQSPDIEPLCRSRLKEIALLARSFRRLVFRLNESYAALTRSERLATIGKIAASVAHELKNPLSGIKMNIRIMQDELSGASEGPAEDLKIIMNEIERMDLYLSELMKLASSESKSRAGFNDFGIDNTVAEADPAEAIRSVVMLFSAKMKHSGIDLRLNLPASITRVRADISSLRQVVMNLLVNAIEAMSDGGPLLVSAELLEEKEAVRVSISDSGCGVHLPRRDLDIFDLMTSNKPEGTGLGLYLCSRIIEDCGGEIGYRNNSDVEPGPLKEKPQCGATFWFDLPISKAGRAVAPHDKST